MKSKTNTKTNNRKSNENISSIRNTSVEINLMANELSSLASAKLPSGVIQGNLAGSEEDIRQDAILLALCWYIRHQQNAERSKDQGPWNSHRSMAIALNFIKLRYAAKLKKSPKTVSSSDLKESILREQVDTSGFDWTTDKMRSAVSTGLNMARKAGTISEANSAVARMVLIRGIRVSDAANHLGVTPGAIYQQLERVKKALRPIMDQIEVPYTI